ncbi:MAG: YidC/Oxa1 family membrane protein insertase, partial [Bacteroidota bacterium]
MQMSDREFVRPVSNLMSQISYLLTCSSPLKFTPSHMDLLLPLNLQQTRSAKAMQELQPKIQELQKKHKNDKPKLTE